ncbi:MAG: hypothetical protein AAF501_12430 [Pseudomonadota bacterium]
MTGETPRIVPLTMSMDDFGDIDTLEDSASGSAPEVLRIGKTPSLVLMLRRIQFLVL